MNSAKHEYLDVAYDDVGLYSIELLLTHLIERVTANIYTRENTDKSWEYLLRVDYGEDVLTRRT